MAPINRGSPILLERVVIAVGFERVANRLPLVSRPLTAWALTFVFVDVVVLQLFKQAMGYPATFLVNPAWLLSPVLVVAAAVALGYLDERYTRVLELIDIESRTADPEQFATLAPPRVRLGLYGLGVGYTVLNAYNIGIGLMLETGGIAEVIGTLVVLPIGYIPVFVEFLTVYIGIMVVLPRKLRRSDFAVHFLDPEGLGGLRPVGELIKLTYYLIVVGLVGFLVFTYGPFVLGDLVRTPYPAPGRVINLAFTAVWLATIGLLGHALYVIHHFMKREKATELAHLDKAARAVVSAPFDTMHWEVTDEERFRDLRQRMEYVNATKEYPTTFAMWSQIVIGLVLPKALQLGAVL